MMKPIIQDKLLDFHIEDFLPLIPRELDLGKPMPPKIGNLVKVIIGMRRSGKSYRLFQEMNALHESGIGWDRICYFNFEDDRLGTVTPATGDTVIETFVSMHPDAADEGLYLFFDELQEMDDWGAWLRRIVDTTKATIYVSGSSSKMLSSEIATEFRGRALDFELLPFSFREFIAARDPSLLRPSANDGETAVYSAQHRLRLAHALHDYLDQGGFPATIGLPAPQRVALLQSYVQRVVLRDVVERHDITRPRVASMLARRALASNGRQMSIRRIENDMRSLGMPTSRELLGDLMQYYEDAYLLFRVREFSMSASERTTSMPKIYAIDSGLAASVSAASMRDEGQRLENAVYLELRRRTVGFRRDGISSYRTREHGYEIDFVVGDIMVDETYELYQVTDNMDDDSTIDRETRALWEAMGEQGLDHGTIIVADGEEREYRRDDQPGRVIRQIPAWKWFMSR
ncbi:ATP-binding protein [Bifidobacterium vespertilionis]|uniref:ATP-binding protein n=1 Tax=Bifidobacterium vespertilionis TaxID=2562524 RepID=A0A5J5DWA3_9BIFI|nr:ATP-binding protein [Bifidobacterium vespertilionis]KAA8820872.1 ATP-binding protein [Bifidobacterium vespertilionis]KAA8820993.1 ATP-binding protein [Bifidobacterium vespertilionis]